MISLFEEEYVEDESKCSHDSSDVFGPSPADIGLCDEGCDDGRDEGSDEHESGETGDYNAAGFVTKEVRKRSSSHCQWTCMVVSRGLGLGRKSWDCNQNSQEAKTPAKNRHSMSVWKSFAVVAANMKQVKIKHAPISGSFRPCSSDSGPNGRGPVENPPM